MPPRWGCTKVKRMGVRRRVETRRYLFRHVVAVKARMWNSYCMLCLNRNDTPLSQ